MALPCKFIKDNYMPEKISVDEYWTNYGSLLLTMKTKYRKLSIMEKGIPSYEQTKNCKNCGKKISGIFGYVSVDDSFLWIYTQRSGYCKECARAKAKSDTELRKKNNAVMYERSKCYVTVKGSCRHYEGGGVVEDVGQNLLLDPSYKTSI